MGENTVLQKKSHNYGLDLLRLYAGFTVVKMHFGGEFLEGLWAVPIFALLSFYLASACICGDDNSRKLKRLWRLTWPHLAWTAAYMVVFNLIYIIFGDESYRAGIRDLLVQLFFGGSEKLNRPMWYLVDIIILTAVWMVIALIIKKRSLRIAAALGIMVIAFVMEYSGLNLWIFARLVTEYRWTCGRLVELMPYACVGILIAEFNLAELVKRHAKVSIPALLAADVILWLASGLEIFCMPQGFCYSGIYFLLRALVVTGIFYALPIGEILNKVPGCDRVEAMFKKLGALSLGVYCIHYGIGTVLTSICGEPIGKGYFYRAVAIYLISLLMVWLISLIPNDLIKKSVI